MPLTDDDITWLPVSTLAGAIIPGPGPGPVGRAREGRTTQKGEPNNTGERANDINAISTALPDSHAALIPNVTRRVEAESEEGV